MDIKIIFLIFLLVVFGFCIYKTKKRKGLSNLFLSLFVTLFLLLLTEFVYRKFFREKQIISTVNLYYKPDSLMGFRFDPGRIKAVEYFENGDTIYNTWYTVLADTNENGMRYPMRKGYKSEKEGKETVFLGCSITFGEGLADEETLPYQYGKLTDISTVNHACNGLGIHQVYQLFRLKYARRDNHNRVFVYSFSSDHLLRAHGLYSWNVAGPYFVLSGDTLISKGPWYKFKRVKGHRLVQVVSFLGTFTFIRDNLERIMSKKSLKALTENDFAPYYLMLRQMAEIIQQSGGKFIILNWDDKSRATGSKILDRDIAEKKINQELIHTGAIILPVPPVIDSRKEYHIAHDGHPSALANKVLAQYLAGHIQ
jgi:hypothetical protein